MGTSDASAFDELANDYDRAFTQSRVGAMLRAVVWQRLESMLPAEGFVLELGCGTGEDAVWLARAGHRVVAIDASPEMIRIARLKAVAAGCADRIEFHCLPIEALATLPGSTRFDAVLSNFGAINCVPDLRALGATLSARLTPGATMLFAVMGRHVPWEWLWFLLRAEPGRAFRRLGRDGVVWRGMRIVYPTPAMLADGLRPHFAVSRVSALGCVLPPGYAAGWLERSPRLLRLFAGLERRVARHPAFAALADHYLFEAHHTPAEFVPSMLERPPRRLWRALAKRIADLVYAIAGRRRYDNYRLEQVAGLRLLVIPSVSNPKALRTGEFFAQQIANVPIGEHTSVLDLGTGSGICALQSARRARGVVAVDINEAAVRCTRINAALNQLEHRVDAREGDLFEPVRGMRFDLVLFNPPFYDGAPRDARDAAWRSADLPARFARQLDVHLAARGEALVLLSSSGDACPRFELELRRQGFALSVFGVRRHVGEIVTILRVQRP
jgi:methylase of polypeptide subunit release factors